MKLLDAFAEVGDPLDNGETGGHSVATPRLGDDAWQKIQNRNNITM